MAVEKVTDYGFLVLPLDGSVVIRHRWCVSVVVVVVVVDVFQELSLVKCTL